MYKTYEFKGIKIDLIYEKYIETKNIWKVGVYFGIKGQSVYSVLNKRGLIVKMNVFTEKDFDFLKENYLKYRNNQKLEELALIMGRTKQFIARKARILGLTNPKDKSDIVTSEERRINQSKSRIEYYKNNEHPKGMLGKSHTDEFKIGASLRSKKMWKTNKKLQSEEYRQNLSDNMSKLQSSGKLNNNYSRTKSGTIVINDKTYFFRSSWESNIAAYFEFLKSKNEIIDWIYEPDVFWFEKIKRGVRSYKPDFKITDKNGNIYYEEVKGWMDDKSKTKLKRMKIYYPKIDIRVLDQKRYKEISKISSMIPLWGKMDNKEVEEFVHCSIDGCENKSFSKTLCHKHYHKVYKKQSKPTN
jgi:hypothetical protein